MAGSRGVRVFGNRRVPDFVVLGLCKTQTPTMAIPLGLLSAALKVGLLVRDNYEDAQRFLQTAAVFVRQSIAKGEVDMPDNLPPEVVRILSKTTGLSPKDIGRLWAFIGPQLWKKYLANPKAAEVELDPASDLNTPLTNMPPIPQIVEGNASDEAKQKVVDILSLQHPHGTFFSTVMSDRLTVIEVNETDGGKGSKLFTVILEMVVEKDMVNAMGNLHGGCSATLLDICTTSAYVANPGWEMGGVSATMNLLYHAPAPIGTRLKIVASLISLGGRTGSSRCEIWDSEKNILVASGTHIKSKVSRNPPRANAKL